MQWKILNKLCNFILAFLILNYSIKSKKKKTMNVLYKKKKKKNKSGVLCEVNVNYRDRDYVSVQ